MTPDFFSQEIWDQNLTQETATAPDWLWHGFVAKRNLTLLTSQWKAGKTTLMSLFLARRAHGGTLAGLAVQPGKTIVISEETSHIWAQRRQHFNFAGNVCFFCQPFRTIPHPNEWQSLLHRVLQLRAQHGIDLLIIDPLAHFLRCENHARAVLDVLLPLRELAYHDMAVCALHHPSKGERAIGQAARGSGALLGHADIIIEMRHPGGDPHTRRRRFLGLSRHAQTPQRMLLEWNAEGTDYAPVTEATLATDDFDAKWESLRVVLQDAPQKLTRRDILLEWPEDFEKPELVTLGRWLNRATETNQVLREGAGHKSDPFRYWLPERELVWRENPCYDLIRQHFRPLHPRHRAKATTLWRMSSCSSTTLVQLLF